METNRRKARPLHQQVNLSPKELRAILLKPPGELTADDLRWLKPHQIESLSPRHVASLTTSLLLGMSAKQLGALTQAQVAVLSLEQMGLVPPSVKRKAVRLAVNLARTEEEEASSRRHVLMARRAWLFLFFILIIPILRIAHKLNLI